MAVPTDTEELQIAWTALAGEAGDDGWRTIRLGGAGPRFRAGIEYPGGHETLVVGFNDVAMPKKADLPEGRGFSVRIVPELAGQHGYAAWLGISRRSGAALDMFTQMATDVVGSLGTQAMRGESWLLALTQARIRAWQDFMRRSRAGVLSPEAELGLAGELIMFELLLDAGADPASVNAAWQGPAGSLQDYLFVVHGLEVKTTLSPNGFPAAISSLDQLDEAQGRAVMLCAIRLCLQENGRELPRIADDLRARLGDLQVLRADLDLKLMQAGYFDVAGPEYLRKFTLVDSRVFAVDDKFPKLVRSRTDPKIRAAEYIIDLDLVGSPSLTISDLPAHGVF